MKIGVLFIAVLLLALVCGAHADDGAAPSASNGRGHWKRGASPGQNGSGEQGPRRRNPALGPSSKELWEQAHKRDNPENAWPQRRASAPGRKKPAPKAAEVAPPPAPELQVPISSTTIPADLQAREESSRFHYDAFSIAASSYRPAKLAAPSRVSGASDFERAGAPALELSYLRALRPGWHLDLGAGYLCETRSVNLTSGGVVLSQAEQRAHVFPLHAGVQWFPLGETRHFARPYLAAAVVPSLVYAGRSVLSDGSTEFGFAGRAALGTALRLTDKVEADLSASQTLGKAADSDLNGFGVGAGLRLKL